MPGPVAPYLPPTDVEYRIAYRLLGARSPFDLDLLSELLARPRRYAELKPILAGRRDHNLTKALARLQAAGLIDRRGDFRKDPPVDTYELTPLGVAVLLLVAQMRTAHHSAEILLRGQYADVRAASTT